MALLRRRTLGTASSSVLVHRLFESLPPIQRRIDVKLMVKGSDVPPMPTYDPDAFWSLVQPHDRALRALAYRLVGDRDLMDDVLQEAYLRAFRGLPSLRAADALGSWLYRIVYTASMDQVRGRQRTAHLALDEAPDPPDLAPDPADVATGRRDLVAALETLPPPMRAAVLLVDAEGLSYEEAGAIMGVPKGTVASRLARARDVLRRSLETHAEGVDER
jgi:RNA polymerase sigma factor (sigma-70 family)